MNESSIFLLEKKNNKYEFSQFPQFIYVDTCFWNEMHGPSSNGLKTDKNQCKDFISDCIANGTTLYTSGLVLDELTHVISQTMFEDMLKTNNIKKYWHDESYDKKRAIEELKKTDKNAVSKVNIEVERVISIVKSATEFLPYEHSEEFDDNVRKIVKESEYIIGTQDATHVVISHQYGLNSIATRDGDFWVLDNANIFAPNRLKYSVQRLGRRNVLLDFKEDKF